MKPAGPKALFDDRGFLIVEDLIDENGLAECIAEIRRLHELAADLEAAGDPAYGSFQREPFSADTSEEGLPVLRKIENTRLHSEVFGRLSAHPRLLKTLEELIGPDLLLYRSTLMLKPARHGSAHGLHQDSAYWPMDPPTLVTVSIALTDAHPENGCFQIIPGSHRWGLQDWGHIARQQDAELTDRQEIAVAERLQVPLRAGCALFFHSLLVHGSGPNTSSRPRNTALYAYFSPHVRYLPGEKGPRERTFPVVAGLGGQREVTLVASES